MCPADKALKHWITLECNNRQHANSAIPGETSIIVKNVFLPCPLALVRDRQEFFFSKKTFFSPFLSSSDVTYIIVLGGIKGSLHLSWELSFITLPQPEHEILPRRSKHSLCLIRITLLVKRI